MYYSYRCESIKGTISDKKNLQITLEINKHTFPSQQVPFFLKTLHNFDRKTNFHRNSMGTVSLHRKISLNLGVKFLTFLSIKHTGIRILSFKKVSITVPYEKIKYTKTSEKNTRFITRNTGLN